MTENQYTKRCNRREWIQSAGAASAILASPLSTTAATEPSKKDKMPLGGAEHVISVWLGGGMGQVDTFDPMRVGDPKSNKAGSLYRSVDTAVKGVQVCEHLQKLAPLMDRVTAVRTVHHEVIDEHAAATNRMHTGRPISGTVTYPSIGSIIAHERRAVNEDVPPYVLMGYPNITRGPGFLGPKHGYIYLTDTRSGPPGLTPPTGLRTTRQERRKRLLEVVQRRGRQAANSRREEYDSTIRQSLRLTAPSFAKVFDLHEEPATLRNAYGGEFGQRCLLSRRLIQRGVRFVEVSHNLNFLNGAGWDVHFEGIRNQHKLIQELDSALATLIVDLEKHKLLEKTLIVVTTEFGRPSSFDSRGGRAHQGRAFTCVLAGGGLKHQGAYGTTDELRRKIVDSPVSVPDFFATICAAVKVDPTKNLYDGDRPVPITDRGRPIRKLFG